MKEVKKNSNVNLDRFRGLFFNIGLVLSIGISLLLFETNFKTSNRELSLNAASGDYESLLDVPISEQPPPPPPVAPTKSINIVSVPDFEEIEEDIQIQLDIDITEHSRTEELVFTEEIEVEPEEEEVIEEIFTIVEQQPSPVGGYEAFYKYVSENLQYPARALRLGIEGRVFVQFVVGSDGSISSAKVIKGIQEDCDKEAIRVVQNAPKWNPGKQRGRPVKVRMVIPIGFTIINEVQ